MSGAYHKVFSRIWDEQWEEQDRYLALYILSCKHRRFEGIYKLPLAYAAEDLGWSRQKVLAGIRRLERHGFVQYDEPTSVIWICKALKYQKPNTNQAKAGAKQVSMLPASKIVEAFRVSAASFSETLASELNGGTVNGS